jgi:predicted phosphodiesterase
VCSVVRPAVPDTINIKPMNILDLGKIDAPVLVFGGPYSNRQATEALLHQAKVLNIPPERIICTGDVVAYCAAPTETTRLVRDAGLHVVQGNCEISFGDNADDCGCGFEEGSTCDRLSAQWFDYARRQLSPEAAHWMKTLPGQIHFEMANRKLAVVHGTPAAVNRFVFPSTPLADKLDEIVSNECDGVICGHSGLPFTQNIDGRLWHNAGVIGLPANDGTPRTWFSLLTPEESSLRIEHLPLSYDFKAASNDMTRAGLPEEYARTLTTGLWDNCDILPATEAGQQGIPLAFEPGFWRHIQQAAE